MALEDKFYLAALARCSGVGSIAVQQLVTAFGTAGRAWGASATELAMVGRLQPRLADRLAAFAAASPDLPEELAASCEQLGVSLVSLYEEEYPTALREIFDPPPVLYVRGTLVTDTGRIGMVGSRRYTPYGEGLATELAERLAAAGLTVVSGAARGIDTFSHRGALKSGRTVAVLGCGIDVAYPSENRRLLREIAESGGAVISEYGPGTQPLPAFFPARNRIIAGLSRGVVVVEAAKRSGSLITAELALAEGRDVFAVPGSVYSTTSQGCNVLIQRGAKLVQDATDILEDYGLVAPPKRKKSVKLTPDERAVYQVLSFEHPLSLDEIVMSLPDGEISNLAFLLLGLELKGLVIENELHAYRRAERE